MNLFLWALYSIFALFIGSFLNLVSLRIPNDKSIVYPPSHCTACNHRLSYMDLIPIISYLGLKGKCRYCSEKISPQYPLGEILTLFFFLLIPYSLGYSKELVIAYPFVAIMIAVTLSDIKYQIIPNKVTYPGIILMLILRLFIHPLPLWNYIIGAIIGGGLLFLLAIVSRGGMGGGDIKLFILIGIVLGWQDTILALFLSSTVGSIIGLILMLFRIIKRKQLIPYGPFIFIGTMITYFFANEIWNWYISFY